MLFKLRIKYTKYFKVIINTDFSIILFVIFLTDIYLKLNFINCTGVYKNTIQKQVHIITYMTFN